MRMSGMNQIQPIFDSLASNAVHQVSEVESRLALALEVADLAGCRSKLAFLELNAAGDELWGDTARAQRLLAEIGSLRCGVMRTAGCRAAREAGAPVRRAAHHTHPNPSHLQHP